MIEFNKPNNLDGNVLEAELKKVGITLPIRSITVIGDKVYLEITEAQKEAAQAVIDSLNV
jgi:hypothetical protein